MGLMQRNKGKSYERKVAAALREHWPDAVIRRASQAERADNPDVFIEGGPTVLSRVWLELTDAVDPKPIEKLQQAERDIEYWLRRRPMTLVNRMPIVIWHRIRERESHVTTRLWVIDELRGISSTSMEVVTFPFHSLPGLLLGAANKEAA